MDQDYCNLTIQSSLLLQIASHNATFVATAALHKQGENKNSH